MCNLVDWFDPRPLKKGIKYVSYGTGIIGLTMLCIGLLLGYFISPFLKQDDNSLLHYDAKAYIGQFFTYQSILFLIVSVLAYYTVYEWENIWIHRGFLTGFVCSSCSLCGIMATAAFLSLTILSVHSAYMYDDRACVREEIFRQTHRMYKKSADILCSSECPCDIQNENLYTQNQLSELVYDNNQNSAINIMGCEQYPEMVQRIGWNENQNHTEFITALEVTFDCAGICNSSPFFVFSDTNRGPPKNTKSCFEVMDSHVDLYGTQFFILSWTLLIGISISFCLGCFLCCSKYEPYTGQLNYINQNQQGYQPVNQIEEDIQQQQHFQQYLDQTQQSNIQNNNNTNTNINNQENQNNQNQQDD